MLRLLPDSSCIKAGLLTLVFTAFDGNVKKPAAVIAQSTIWERIEKRGMSIEWILTTDRGSHFRPLSSTATAKIVGPAPAPASPKAVICRLSRWPCLFEDSSPSVMLTAKLVKLGGTLVEARLMMLGVTGL